MIILDKPYVSDLLINTCINNNFEVLENEFSKEIEGLNFINKQTASLSLKDEKIPLIYCNSENSIDFIENNLSFTGLPEKINLFKNKIKFRKLISSIYPEFYFEEFSFEELTALDKTKIKYPVVLKPSVGFLSFGVYSIYNEKDFDNAILSLKTGLKKIQNVFPKTVVDTSKFILEELIKGEEYAVDVYFNDNSEPVILNIFKHPFVSKNDVSDRLYYTSKEIIKTYFEKFTMLAEKIAKKANLKNFPAHIELRVNEKNIVPIEVNPMRFAGWCLTDLAYYAYGINVYEYFMKGLKPDWNEILKDKDGIMYYFVVAPLPENIDKSAIKGIDYDKFSTLMQNPLEIRKIDYKTLPLFATAFSKTNDYGEIERILNADFTEFVKTY